MKKLPYFFLLIFLTSCSLKEQEKVNAKTYFDLAGYFKNEAARLGKENPTVHKTVAINGSKEEKELKISNWAQEFNSFIDADINKASWRGSFKLDSIGGFKTYTASSGKIPVKKVAIGYQNGKLASIQIVITNTNDLYTSEDTLNYYPGRSYEIKKTQQIRLMAAKSYQVIGKF